MPFLIPVATVLITILTVKTVNKSMKVYERRRKRNERAKI